MAGGGRLNMQEGYESNAWGAVRQLDLALHGVAATQREYEEAVEVIWWELLLEVRELVKRSKP